MRRFVFDIGVSFLPNHNIQHKTVIVMADDFEDALALAVEWQMEMGRKKNRNTTQTWPSRWGRPDNVTSFKLLSED